MAYDPRQSRLVAPIAQQNLLEVPLGQGLGIRRRHPLWHLMPRVDARKIPQAQLLEEVEVPVGAREIDLSPARLTRGPAQHVCVVN